MSAEVACDLFFFKDLPKTSLGVIKYKFKKKHHLAFSKNKKALKTIVIFSL